jgi:hypothetical protein
MNVAGEAFEKEVNDVSAAGESLAESLDETPSIPEQSSASDTVEPKSTPRRKPKSVPKDQADDVKS